MLKKIIMILLAASMLFAYTGCSNDEGSSPESGANVKALDGTVVIDGSGTVYPLMAYIAEDYMTKEEPGVSVQVGRAGSSAGFKKFIPGETDFSDASRGIKDEEVALLKEQGLEMDSDVIEIKLALDGLTMVINKENDWATEMAADEIISMYISGSYKTDDVVLWSDIRPDWPSEEIKFYGPNENHGTYEFFYEKILDEQAMVTTASLQQEYSTLVDLVANDQYAIAYFGYGYYESNQDKLQAVNVDFGEGAVAPNLETIGEDLPYAQFTRPVFTYLNVNYAKEKPQVMDFAKYIVSPQGAERLAGETGFAPLPSEAYAKLATQLDAIQ